MKKVLLVATVQSHIGQFHKPLMRLLKEYGWEIHVAARNNLAEKNGLQLEYPDMVFDIPFQRSPLDRRNLEAYRQLKQLLASTHYDVVHCNTPVGGVLARLAARKYRKQGTKVYYTVHGFHFYKGAPKKNWMIYYPIEKWLDRYTDKLITINEEDFRFAKSHFSCPVYHIHGVGVNSAKFHPISQEEQASRRAKMGLNGPVILNVGELNPNKNQKTAILAFKQVLKSFPNAKLLIAGKGTEQKNLEQLVKMEGLEGKAVFLGYTLELEKYMQICDVEISCSYREGLPLNVLEAMLCGKPVIASNNRGHRELIQEGINGYLIGVNDADHFAKAICKLLTDDAADSNIIKNSIEAYTDKSVCQELKKIILCETVESICSAEIR